MSGGGTQTQATLTYVAGAAAAAQTTLISVTSSIAAGGADAGLDRAGEGRLRQQGDDRRRDRDGHEAGGTGSIGSVSDNGNGTYTATVTSPNLVGSGVFVATLGGQPVKDNAASQTQATVTYVAVAAAKLKFTLQPSSNQNIAEKGTGSFSVDVSVVDSLDNVVTGDSR